MKKLCEHISSGEGYGPFKHYICEHEAHGRLCTIYVNPDLFDHLGDEVINHPDWYKGKQI